jgi:hypothetical protein
MANAVMRAFGIESLSSSQVSRAAKLLDAELEAWRNRPLGEIRYLVLDARLTRRRATVGSCATPPCSRRSASARTSAAGCWASRSPSPRRRCTGARSWRASSAGATDGADHQGEGMLDRGADGLGLLAMDVADLADAAKVSPLRLGRRRLDLDFGGLSAARL